MIDLETIEREISELEARQPSYKLCERLSWLYIVRDHIKDAYPKDEARSLNLPSGGSEFMEAASGKNYEDVMKVVDDHLETIKLLYPKTYDGLVERIRQLQ